MSLLLSLKPENKKGLVLWLLFKMFVVLIQKTLVAMKQYVLKPWQILVQKQ